MSGHSKWSTIKRKKAATDAKRGKLFTRLLKEIQVAAKMGGAIDGNPRLKTAVQAAKAQSVPADNIDRAIKRGSGEIDGADYEDIIYEGYGPGGVAILVNALTDNRNRTVADVRHCLSKHGGSMGGSNSVAYLFKERGIFSIESNKASEDQLFELVLDAGAEDVKLEGDRWEVSCPVAEYANVRAAMETLGQAFQEELRFVPDTTIKLEGADAISMLKMMDALDDLDDVQNVTANFEIDDAVMESMA